MPPPPRPPAQGAFCSLPSPCHLRPIIGHRLVSLSPQSSVLSPQSSILNPQSSILNPPLRQDIRDRRQAYPLLDMQMLVPDLPQFQQAHALDLDALVKVRLI